MRDGRAVGVGEARACVRSRTCVFADIVTAAIGSTDAVVFAAVAQVLWFTVVRDDCERTRLAEQMHGPIVFR